MALAAVNSFIPSLRAASGRAVHVVQASILTGFGTLRSYAVGMLKEPAQAAWITAIAIEYLQSNQNLPNSFIVAAGIYLSLKGIQNLTQYRQPTIEELDCLCAKLMEERERLLQRGEVNNQTIGILYETIETKDGTIECLRRQIDQLEKELWDLRARHQLQIASFCRVAYEALWNQLRQIANMQRLQPQIKEKPVIRYT